MASIDFNNQDCPHSNMVRSKIKWLSTYILSKGMNTSMRKISRETGIPRRTLHRYMVEYTLRLAVCNYPDYDKNGVKIDYREVRRGILRLIAHNTKTRALYAKRKRKTGKSQ